MNLKEELEKIEEEEREQEVEDIERLRNWETDDKIKGLYQRVNAIIEHIDKEEKATPEEEELWDCGYSEGYEDGVNSVMNDNRKEIEARKEELAKEGTSSEYVKGYEDGFKALAEHLRDDIDQSMANKQEMRLIHIIGALEKGLTIKIPQPPDLASIISQTQPGGKKEKTEGEPKEKDIDSAKSTKDRVLGLGRAVGDV